MSTSENFSYPKSARLTSTKAISTLYEKGRRGSAKSLRYVLYCENSANSQEVQDETQTRVKVLVSVPKRLFKRAVKRNKLKRRIREAYRLRRSRLETLAINQNCYISLGIMYSCNDELEYKKIDDAVEKIISNIEKYG